MTSWDASDIVMKYRVMSLCVTVTGPPLSIWALNRGIANARLGVAARGAEGILAGADAGAQADPGRGGSAGEQDGARDLGDADAR